MSLKENISSTINSDINAQISSDAATNISEEVNSHISLKTLSLKESGEIVTVNNVTYSTVHDNISMYNNFVADDYYASKSWVLSKNYLTKEDIGDIDITNNIEELLNNKADKNHDHNDLYYTKDITDTNNNLLKEELTNKIPTKTSQLVNDSNYTTATQLNKVTELIPNTATAENQLADKNFVNSSISTATAEFRGTVENLEDLNNLIADINDYAFYKHKDENGNTVFDRYKFNDQWDYEYTLNNSSFTAEQWGAINSEITSSLVNTIRDNATALNNLSEVAKTGSYVDLIDKPIIPTKTSELINDNNYTTSEDIQTAIDNIPPAGFEDILGGIVGRTKVEWNNLNAGEYSSNSTYNGATLPPVMIESATAFWNSGSGKPLDISFHFAKKEKITSLQVKCPPYGGNSTTMTIYYAQEGDTELTLYKKIATIPIIERKTYDFNEEGIFADYWVIRFTASGWIDLRLCKPVGSFTPGLYSEVFHEQIMDKLNGYQPVGNYALKSEIPTVPTKTSQLTNDSSYITSTDLNKITELIPDTATTENKLVDKNFVNSSISTATATFKGTFDNLTELQQTSADLNDYAYFKHTDDNHNIVYSRYKYSDGVWNFEYDLNTTGFTAEQWATINSGLTANSIPTKISELVNDSGFTSNQGTITEIKVNGISKGASGSVNLTNMVTFASSQRATVAGVTKTTYRYNQPAGDQDTDSSNGSAYFPEGIITGGTAFSAGLVTRGITGVTTPNATTGACNKENLYINFDGNFNDYSYKSNRQVILQAAIPGTHYGSNLYQYAAARGDAVKNYCDSTYALKSEIPTVNNASLIIQQNGVDIATFTANSATDTTVDITIPTSYVDLTSDQQIGGIKIFETIPKLSRSAYVNADVVLPDEYQLVEYIQSSGTEYIDTNSRIIANTRFTCTWGSVFNNGSLVAPSSENKGYGQGNASGANPNIAGGGRLQNGVITFWISGSNYSTSLGKSVSTSVYTDIITTSENTLSFNMTDIISDTVFINNTLTNFTIYPVNNMFLFRDSSGQYPFYSAKKIYDVKFETRASSLEDFVIVKHLIPCYRKLDHVCGFYDIIGNEFYTNKGTGTLLAGPDVIDGKLLYDLGFNYNTVLSELRSITGYNSSKTQVLKNVNGIFKWVDE